MPIRKTISPVFAPFEDGIMIAHRLMIGIAACLLLIAPRAAVAADPPATGTALDKVPADAEYFSSMLRMGETVAAIGRTRAWQQLWNEPEVQALWKKALEKYNADDNPLKAFLADPANKELPALAADAFSNEVFIAAGAGTSDMAELFMELLG